MIIYPSKLHEEYIDRSISTARACNMNLYLKGSLAKGNATPYSDIDLLVTVSENEDVRKLIYGYGTPVMISATKNPPGIFIVIYSNGLCIDLDVRLSIGRDEFRECIVLAGNKPAHFVKDYERDADVSGIFVLDNVSWYSHLRLFHRSLIKVLSEKIFEGVNLLEEIKDIIEDTNNDKITWSGNYVSDISIALEYISEIYQIPHQLHRLLLDLIGKVQVDSDT